MGNPANRLPLRLLGLFLAGGYVDARGYLELGHVVPAHMTGIGGMPARSWLAYGRGALAGALLEHGAHAAVIAWPLVAVVVAGLLARM